MVQVGQIIIALKITRLSVYVIIISCDHEGIDNRNERRFSESILSHDFYVPGDLNRGIRGSMSVHENHIDPVRMPGMHEVVAVLEVHGTVLDRFCFGFIDGVGKNEGGGGDLNAFGGDICPAGSAAQLGHMFFKKLHEYTVDFVVILEFIGRYPRAAEGRRGEVVVLNKSFSPPDLGCAVGVVSMYEPVKVI